MTLILTDVDGVLADFVGHACKTIYNTIGEAYTPRDFEYFEMSKTLSDEAVKVLHQATCTQYWCSGMPAYVGASEFISALRDIGDVVALTAAVGSSDHWINERKEWLAEGFGFIQEELIFCPGPLKQYVAGNILIEDRLDTCTQWAERNDTGIALLCNQPWNQGPTPFGVYRVSSYREALALIEGSQ